jgi:hypothetical protein
MNNKLSELDSNNSNENTKSYKPVDQPIQQLASTKVKLTKSQRKRIKKQLIKKQTIEEAIEVEKEKSAETPPVVTASTQIVNPTNISNKNSKKKQKKANSQTINSSKETTESLMLTSKPAELEDEKQLQQTTSKSKKSKNKKNNSLEAKNPPSKPEQTNQSKKQNDKPKKTEPIAPVCKKINDISDFSDAEEYATINYDYFDQLNKQENESNQVNQITGDNLSGGDEEEENDQGGEWVKVAGNRQLITETRKPKKNFTDSVPLVVPTKPVKISNSLNSLDSFKDITEYKLKSNNKKVSLVDNAIKEVDLKIKEMNLKEKNNSSIEAAGKLSTVDLLIPNSIDEEEIMLKKALELSLKETSTTAAVNNPVNNNKTKFCNKLGLDDFNDDSSFLPIKAVNIDPLMSKNLTNVKINNLKPPTPLLIQQVKQSSSIDVKTQTNGNLIANRPSALNKNVTSFAAAAAASLNKTVTTNPAIVSQKQVPFKWNNLNNSNPSETKKFIEPIMNQIKPDQKNPDNASKRSCSSSSSIKEFTKNGVDLPLSVQSPVQIDEKKGLIIESENPIQNNQVSAPMPSPFTMIDNLFSHNTLQENDNKNGLYGIASLINDDR